jgi:PhzF family phenazine biosynthesis protein
MSPRVIQYTTVDSFTEIPFSGNSTATIIVNDPLDDATQQLIAREFNYAETAFLVPRPQESSPERHVFGLRWFTPKVEVKLCGHATLGAAKTLFATPDMLPATVKTLSFHTLSGLLDAQRLDDGRFELCFPAGNTKLVQLSEQTRQTLGTAVGTGTPILGIHEGTEEFKGWLVVEVEPSVDLKSLPVDIAAVVSLIFPTACLDLKAGRRSLFLPSLKSWQSPQPGMASTTSFHDFLHQSTGFQRIQSLVLSIVFWVHSGHRDSENRWFEGANAAKEGERWM